MRFPGMLTYITSCILRSSSSEGPRKLLGQLMRQLTIRLLRSRLTANQDAVRCDFCRVALGNQAVCFLQVLSSIRSRTPRRADIELTSGSIRIPEELHKELHMYSHNSAR